MFQLFIKSTLLLLTKKQLNFQPLFTPTHKQTLVMGQVHTHPMIALIF